ncbi:glycine betaine/proline transport system substrate-binding protein [Desulfocicer vacuolatum DSM 3385]|uniref:Glycine betaine/proline transport system substrate-binding protein n=1 Tax=Desulfocicer vacuolatum DSM 3385 TaxID=1121400 RepID=A0A1W2ATX3_9BACT|nr:glycine betaine ABC transporter substrate-binding protein [Desulfocicer vacuolatum]SMC64146.1 glycine betaine/proline transport system substrate-binding protein [Desulfocicer vacuolatum DSM 3385]
MKLKLTVLISVLMMLCISTATFAEEKKVIKMGVMQWNDLVCPSLVTKKLMEKNYGYEIEVVEFFEWGIAFATLAKGDVDLLMSQIDFAAHDYWTRYNKKLEKLSASSHGLFQGIVVPSYIPIDSIDQLNENKDKFGKKIIGIEPGAGLMRQTHQVIEAYDLDFELVDGSTAAMTAAVKSSMAKKQWFATVMWTPSWMTQAFDIKFLKDPKGIQQPSQSYYWVGRKGFAKEFPKAREIMAGVFVPLEENVKMTGYIKEGLAADKAVERWLDENQMVTERWMNLGQ